MNHQDLLSLLLPPKSYDAKSPLLAVELAAEGRVLDQVLWSAEQILAEADPRTCVVTLPDWERVYGLPEPEIIALGIPQSIQERRAALVAKVAMLGGQSRSFFITLAARLGYSITITELHPQTTEDTTEYPVQDEQYEFIWRVNAPLATVRYQTAEDDTEMATAVWGNGLLEAAINRYKPAHTLALFSYS